MMKPAHEENVQELRRRLEEAEETLRAIRGGEVDALVVDGNDGERVYTLQGAEQPYRALIEAMQQGAVTLTTDGTVLYCNHCFADMLKVPQQKVIGAHVDDFITPAQRQRFKSLLRMSLTDSSHGELEFQATDGTVLPIYVALARFAPTEAVEVCMVVTDLTEQRKHRDLQDAERRKDEFLAMLAHELRNPLAPIQNAVGILQHLGLADEKLTDAREIIARQLHHLSRLVDDLLDVSRITLGKVVLEKEPIEIATIIARAIETSRPTIDSRRHQLTVSLPPNSIRVLADPTRLAQVIGNLLTNAAKYTEDAGEIALKIEARGAEVILSVRDSGVGITPELLPRIFDLFIQGDRSLARSEGGLGIGLTVVHRLVKLHGGSVEVHSDGPGKGSEFIVRLPTLAAEQQRGEAPKQPESEPHRGLSRNVLIVEDNRDGAESLATLLNLMGHQVHVAHNGLEALATAEAIHPQVVLLDIGLPGMNGYEVAEHIRDRPELGAPVLIAMTGYGQEEDKRRSKAAGFKHHLVKPVNLRLVQRLLESLE